MDVSKLHKITVNTLQESETDKTEFPQASVVH